MCGCKVNNNSGLTGSRGRGVKQPMKKAKKRAVVVKHKKTAVLFEQKPNTITEQTNLLNV